MPNVTSKNNTLVYMFNYNGTQTQRTITFDDGLYSINDLNYTISRFTEIGMNGNDNSLIQFYADESTSKIIVYFSQGNITIKETNNNIMIMLGFPNTDFGAYATPGDIKGASRAYINSLQNILVKCDITTGSYFNSNFSNIIACITPDVLPYSTIIYNPIHPLRSKINVKRIDEITITLVDQDNNDIDMGSANGNQTPELFSIVLSIEPVNMPGLL